MDNNLSVDFFFVYLDIQKPDEFIKAQYYYFKLFLNITI